MVKEEQIIIDNPSCDEKIEISNPLQEDEKIDQLG